MKKIVSLFILVLVLTLVFSCGGEKEHYGKEIPTFMHEEERRVNDYGKVSAILPETEARRWAYSGGRSGQNVSLEFRLMNYQKDKREVIASFNIFTEDTDYEKYAPSEYSTLSEKEAFKYTTDIPIDELKFDGYVIVEVEGEEMRALTFHATTKSSVYPQDIDGIFLLIKRNGRVYSICGYFKSAQGGYAKVVKDIIASVRFYN